MSNAEILLELHEIMRLIEDLPSGIDLDANPYDTKPSDAIAWQGGIIYARVAALASQIEGGGAKHGSV